MFDFGGSRDVCMDLEPCFKVHNLIVTQLSSTKLNQMTNRTVVFHMVVSIYKLDTICNSTYCSPLLNPKVANKLMLKFRPKQGSNLSPMTLLCTSQ